ncbi:MAG: RodZ domain-containing protein [Pseudohongiellaceae bacterium]
MTTDVTQTDEDSLTDHVPVSPGIPTSKDEPAAPVAGNGPAIGARLRETRKRSGLSEQSVSEQLHITMHYVRSLEEDNYAKLPGDVFARGYIRNYAILLGLEPEPLIAEFDLYSGARMEASRAESKRVRAKHRRDRNRPWVILSVILFVAGFLGLWLFNSFFASAAEPDRGVPSTTNVPAALPDSPAAAIMPEDGNVVEAIAEEVTEIVSGGTDQLQIEFSGESWVEIGDNGNRSLYRDIGQAGDIVRITGQRPFSILLGDAPYAKVTLNGYEIDVAGDIRIDNSARLSVGLQF